MPYVVQVMAFLLSHIPLAMAMRQVPAVVPVHAAATFALGLWWLSKDERPNRVIYLAAYVVGAEMLWRANPGAWFWEFGKYSTVALLALSTLKFRKLLRADKKPLLYLALLLPSVFLMPHFDRSTIAFNLAGPFALAMSALFFSATRLGPSERRRILLSILAPVVGMSFIVLNSTMAAESIDFRQGSMFETSGGVGPNQASSVLGLGALVAFLYAFGERKQRLLRALMICFALGLAAQSALTFSRGGMVTTLLALLAAMFCLLRDRRSRAAVLVGGVVTVLVAVYLIFPALNDFTKGELALRFGDQEATGRFEIMRGELTAFAENPLTGVGPGQGRAYRGLFFRESSAHTEYTRLLAEHGVPGMLALLVLFAIAVQHLGKSASPLGKAYAVSFSAWALLFMAHSAMRMAAPSFLFGLASAEMLDEDENPNAMFDSR